MSEFDSNRSGIIGITLDDDDELVGVLHTDGNCEVMLVTAMGQAIRFKEDEVRPMGRQARGVIGVRLEDGDSVVAVDRVRPDTDLLVITERGYGKRTPVAEYRRTGRGGKGIRTLNVTHKNGKIAGARVVREDEEVMAVSANGIMIRVAVKDISRQGRSTQGVTVMKLDSGDSVGAVAQVAGKDDEGEE